MLGAGFLSIEQSIPPNLLECGTYTAGGITAAFFGGFVIGGGCIALGGFAVYR